MRVGLSEGLGNLFNLPTGVVFIAAQPAPSSIAPLPNDLAFRNFSKFTKNIFTYSKISIFVRINKIRAKRFYYFVHHCFLV